jgi:hypothetical protein
MFVRFWILYNWQKEREKKGAYLHYLDAEDMQLKMSTESIIIHKYNSSPPTLHQNKETTLEKYVTEMELKHINNKPKFTKQ